MIKKFFSIIDVFVVVFFGLPIHQTFLIIESWSLVVVLFRIFSEGWRLKDLVQFEMPSFYRTGILSGGIGCVLLILLSIQILLALRALSIQELDFGDKRYYGSGTGRYSVASSKRFSGRKKVLMLVWHLLAAVANAFLIFNGASGIGPLGNAA